MDAFETTVGGVTKYYGAEHQAAKAADEGAAVTPVVLAWVSAGELGSGELVEITQAEIDAQAATNEADRYAKLLVAKRAEINAARYKANTTTFPYGGKLIACDALSRSDIDGVNGYVALNGTLPVGFPNQWKAVDNTYVAIPDVATWNLFYTAMVAEGASNFAHSQTKKAAIDAIEADGVMTTAEKIVALEAISW